METWCVAVTAVKFHEWLLSAVIDTYTTVIWHQRSNTPKLNHRYITKVSIIMSKICSCRWPSFEGDSRSPDLLSKFNQVGVLDWFVESRFASFCQTDYTYVITLIITGTQRSQKAITVNDRMRAEVLSKRYKSATYVVNLVLVHHSLTDAQIKR